MDTIKNITMLAGTYATLNATSLRQVLMLTVLGVVTSWMFDVPKEEKPWYEADPNDMWDTPRTL